MERGASSAKSASPATPDGAGIEDAPFRLLVEQIADIVTLLDGDGIVRYQSPSIEAALGHRPEDRVGRDIFATPLVHPDDLAHKRRFLADALAHPELPATARFRLRHADGSWRVMEARGVNRLDDPRLRAIVAVYRDVTARREADLARERAERESERARRLQAVTAALAVAATREAVAAAAVQHSMAAIGAAAGALGILVEGGRGIERLAMQGYPREIVEGTRYVPLESLGPLAEAAHTGEAVWLETGAALFERYPELAAIPARRQYGATVTAPLIVDGRVLGVLALRFAEDRPFDAEARDLILTIARQSAQALERAQLYQAAQVQAARVTALATASQIFARASLDLPRVADAVLRVAAETIGDGVTLRLLSADGARLDPLGVHHPVPETLELMRALAATPHGATEGLQGRVAQSGAPLRLTERDLDTAGTAIKATYRTYFDRVGLHGMLIVPLRVQGRNIGTLGVSRDHPGRPYTADDEQFLQDLADRAALAIENARLYQQAQEAIGARDRFISIAAHELRTPVTGLKGYAQLLQRRLDRGELSPQRLARYIAAIDKEAGRLTRLTQDLLDISRLHGGRLVLERRPLDLAREIPPLVHRAIDQVGASHRLLLAVPELPCPVLADADQIAQIVSNLVENAVKYSPEGGPISVTVARIGDRVRLSVRDEGIGLPPGAAETIFTPFERAENALRLQLPGLGLGLSICRDLAERNEGRLWAESPGEGQGTTVALELPLLPSPEQP